MAGIERGDFQAAFDTGDVAPDFEWVAAAEIAEQRSHRGREEFVEFMRRWTEDFDGYSIQSAPSWTAPRPSKQPAPGLGAFPGHMAR